MNSIVIGSGFGGMAAALRLKNMSTLKSIQSRRPILGNIKLFYFQQTRYSQLQQVPQRVLELFGGLQLVQVTMCQQIVGYKVIVTAQQATK